MHPNTKDGLKIACLGLLSLVLPAALTLSAIKHPGTLQVSAADPSPRGYTISLLLFFVPDVLLVGWLLRHPLGRMERRAFLATVASVFAVGGVLDLAFARAFFTFPNPSATLGLRLPAWSFAEMRWIRDALPIEEFAFYALGAVFMTGLYAWADLRWTPEKSTQAHKRAVELASRRLLGLHWHAIVFGAGLVALGVAYRTFVAPVPGFPGYFVFLVCLSVAPSVLLQEVAAPLVNWPAFTLMFVMLQLISIVWEATLAVPYGWWNYNHAQMLGVF